MAITLALGPDAISRCAPGDRLTAVGAGYRHPMSAPDAGEIAECAGLVHRGSDRPGIRRRRRGRGFSYVRPDGSSVAQRERARIVAMAIPPAWSDVWVAPEPDSHLLATGLDDAGRRQHLYHPEWRRAADEAKFARLAGFGRGLERIRRRVDRDLAGATDDRLCAVVIRLIDRALLRPGGRSDAVDDAVGASTLGPGHVELHGGRVVLDFVGKSGVDHHVEFRDVDVARALARRLDEAGDDETLFAGADGATVDARRLNRYMAETTRGPWTAKDLRTFGGTVVAVDSLAARDRSSDGRDSTNAAAAVREAIVAASEALGNTPDVCRSSYVAPAVIEAFGNGRLEACWKRTRRGAWLSRAERTTDRLLART